MAINFDAFDRSVDIEQIKKDLTSNHDYTPVPSGDYIVSIVKMGIIATKKEKKPMFSVCCRIIEGEHQGKRVYLNRVIGGNRTTAQWNDGLAIQSVITWINKLGCDIPIKFENFSQFAKVVEQVFNAAKESRQLYIEYQANAFHSISINEVYEV